MRRILITLLALATATPALAQEWTIEGNNYEIQRRQDQNSVIYDNRRAVESQGRYMDRYGEGVPNFGGGYGGGYAPTYGGMPSFGGGGGEALTGMVLGLATGMIINGINSEQQRQENQYNLPPEDRNIEGKVRQFVGGDGICRETYRGSGIGHCDNKPWKFANGHPVGPLNDY